MPKLKFKLSFVCLIIFSVILQSCSSESGSFKVIPKESNLVSVINISSIAQKGKLGELENMKFGKEAIKQSRQENKKLSRLLEEVMETPEVSGINFLEDIFVFYLKESRDEDFACMTGAIADEMKFEKFLDDLLDESDVDYDIDENEKCKFTLVEDELIIGWDKEKVLILAATNYSSRKNLEFEMEYLFDLKKDENITLNTKFMEFYQEKKDVSVFINSSILFDIDEFSTNEIAGFEIENNYLYAHLNFGDKKIQFTSKLDPNPKNIELLGGNDPKRQFNKSLLNYLPEQSFASLTLNVEPELLYEQLEDISELDRFQREVKNDMGFTLEKFIESFGGSAVYSLLDFREQELTYMSWGYGFNEDNAKLLDRRYPISEAGYISSEKKALLNQGKTVQVNSYNYQYCINIQNVLDNGGTVETAIASDVYVNWYEGGWEYGKYIENTAHGITPIMAVVCDLENDEVIQSIIEVLVAKNELLTKDDYYEFMVDEKFPTYIKLDGDKMIITNDEDCIVNFSNGGMKNNLSNSSMVGLNNLISTNMNLDFDSYPKVIQKKFEDNADRKESRLLKVWDDYLKSSTVSVKGGTELSFDIITTGKSENSLFGLISTFDEVFEIYN